MTHGSFTHLPVLELPRTTVQMVRGNKPSVITGKQSNTHPQGQHKLGPRINGKWTYV